MLPLVSLSYVDVALVVASPQMDRDSFLLPSAWGLTCTTDPHLPTNPMSLHRLTAGVWETLCLSCSSRISGLDLTQCPTSSWAAGLRKLCPGLVIHSREAVSVLFLGFIEHFLCGPELFHESPYLNNLRGQDSPLGLQMGDQSQRSEAAALRSHSQEGAGDRGQNLVC